MKYQREDGREIKFITIMEDAKNASTFRHFKNKDYKIVTIAEHTEEGGNLVIYQAQYGERKFYARPAEMFFSKVDKEKYPDVEQEYRLELLEKTQDREDR